MKVDGKAMRPIARDEKTGRVRVIDQRLLPHELVMMDLTSVDETIHAIKDMVVRGAPLIGATGAFGVYTALTQKGARPGDTAYLEAECARLRAARPTAVNLAWGVDRVLGACLEREGAEARVDAALTEASAIVEEEAENCRRIGLHGLDLIRARSLEKGGDTVHVLTHCNAGWLACIEYGTATAPLYAAHDGGIDIHVWVDETRPLNQGSRLTAWELGKHGVRHTVVTDNAGGHLMQRRLVDMVVVGTDRTTRTGDVANKIGTYLKALAARHNGIPFYVALPSSTIDWTLRDGLEIPIEERDPDEVRWVQGLGPDGRIVRVLVPPEQSPAANPAFDVTPAGLVTGLITERGVCEASEQGILSLFPGR
jgi:methylthioribose-1-phosphate isomerase